MKRLAFLVTFLLMQDVATTIMILVLMALFTLVVLGIFRKKLTQYGQRNRTLSVLRFSSPGQLPVPAALNACISTLCN